jgi:hypothetical protein
MEDLLGSNPTGSAPLYACARPVTQSPGHTGKAQVGLYALSERKDELKTIQMSHELLP